jgi:hypothetical protein
MEGLKFVKIFSLVIHPIDLETMKKGGLWDPFLVLIHY